MDIKHTNQKLDVLFYWRWWDGEEWLLCSCLLCFILLIRVLKSWAKPKREILDLSTYPERISDSYLIYIYKNLINDKYLDGITFVSLPRLGIDKNLEYFKDYEDAVITPKGIEFLQENSLMRKAYDIVKDFKPW